jgi:lipopolysaccharide/colanic/teichoic acid biosynthesis glycosyltransferase
MKKVAFIYLLPLRLRQLEIFLKNNFDVAEFNSAISFIEYNSNNSDKFDLIIFVADIQDTVVLSIVQKAMPYCRKMAYPVVLLSEQFSFNTKKTAVREGISSIFELSDINHPKFIQELNKIIDNPPIRIAQDTTVQSSAKNDFRYTTPIGKRLFDITVSGLVLVLVSPVYALIALLIKLESKGPIFYTSKRVGAGYQIFDFYKFRTMVPDADKKLKSLSHLNQYATAAPVTEVAELSTGGYKCEVCGPLGIECENMLYDDTGTPICEKVFLKRKKEKKDTFFKISNDPRITKLGKFLRNSSLDEIPQVYNVFKGDMSIVGNRPLPLYEAEKLTNDMFTKRFLAPAGLTGLWQVTKRGKGGPMSEEERIGLDNVYADHYNFLFDLKIILKTIPALFQKDNV